MSDDESGGKPHQSVFGSEKIRENLKKVKHKLVVMSGKGGVGKSTVAANLAYTLSTDFGREVGLIDADIHGPTIPKMFGLAREELLVSSDGKIMPFGLSPKLRLISMGLLLNDPDSPVIWRGPLKMGAIRQFLEEVSWGDLDYLIVDLPPGTGDEPLSIAQLLPNPNNAIIVTTPQDVALLSVRKCINFARTLNMNVLGIIENMSSLKCPHCGKEITLFPRRGGVLKTALDFNITYLGAIPMEPKIAEVSDDGKPFMSESMPENSEVKSAFKKIVNKIESVLYKS